jgi:hypothetical protein
MRSMIRRRALPPGPTADLASRRFTACTALAVTIAAAVALGGARTASAATAVSTTNAIKAGAVAAPSTARTQTVTLPTGERVLVAEVDGKTTYEVTGLAGTRNAYGSYQAGATDHYIIPSEAEPYLGSVLSPSLFDVTQLLHAGLGGGGQIPVSLAFAAGVTPSAPPGVTLTSSAGSIAQGYLTASSGAAFAAGLRAAIGADVAAGRPAGSGPLFGGLASMSLAEAAVVAPPAAVGPHYVLHTLEVDSTDADGAPLSAVALLLNVGSHTSENAYLPIGDGIARIEVPAGDYSLGTDVYDYDSSGQPIDAREMVLDDITVPDAAGATTTVRFDESDATSPISAVTPKPTTPEFTTATWTRADPTGWTDVVENVVQGDVPMYVDPQPAATTIGSTHFQVQLLDAGPTTGPQYRYDAAFEDTTVPADEAYRLVPSQLATVQQGFYDDPADDGTGDQFLVNAIDPYNASFQSYFPVQSYSGPVTEYVGTADAAEWEQGAGNDSDGVVVGDPHVFQAGHSYRVDWLRGPLAPNVGQYSNAPATNDVCFACASGSTATLGFNWFGDSEPDHVGIESYGDNPTGLAVYENGTLIVSSPYVFQYELGALPAGTVTFREVYDTQVVGNSLESQSTATHTDLTFRYTPGSDPDTTLPSSYACDYTQAVAAPCQVLPVISLNYRIAENHLDTSAAPVQSMALTVGHLSYDGHGSHAPITSARVSVSFDGGRSWVPALVAGLDGHYTVLWRNPVSAAGTSPELQVAATDASGGSITQTITAAYTIAARLT